MILSRLVLAFRKTALHRPGVSILTFLILSMAFSGLAFAWPIPDTGQTKCYDNTGEIPCPQTGEPFYGQDGNYSINPMSFTKLDGSGNVQPDSASFWAMVRDNVTGLIWEVKRNMDGVKNYDNPHDADNTYTWYDSNPETNGGDVGWPGDGTDTEDYINALNARNYGRYSDWRMPTVNELRSIVDYSGFDPVVSTAYFPNTKSSFYWSSTTYEYTGNAWSMHFHYGGAHDYGKSFSGYVRAVRSEQSGSLDHLVINGDSTVTDAETGLMWEQKTDDDGPNDKDDYYTWEQALEWVEDLNASNFLGYNDWRLPTLKEIASIIDYRSINPAISTAYFPNTKSSYYWSSTTSVNGTDYAWDMNFDVGHHYFGHKSYGRYVRAVRGGQNLLLDHLAISSPAQASIWKTDMTMHITWDTRELGGNVSISISRDGGKTFEPISASTPNDGSFAWAVGGAGSVNCALKVTPLLDPSQATTQCLFTIDIEKGDLNNDGAVDLTDAVLAIQIIAGIQFSTTIYKPADVNDDDKIGMKEMIYILQKISGVR